MADPRGSLVPIMWHIHSHGRAVESKTQIKNRREVAIQNGAIATRSEITGGGYAMSVAGSRKSTIGPGHDGGPKAGFYAAPGEAGLTSHPHSVPKASGMEEVTGVKATLGKPPKMKRAYTDPVPMHNGSNAKSRRTGEHFHGLSGQDLSRYDANPGDDPLAGAPRGKKLAPPRAAWGPPGVDLLAEQGRHVIDEAIDRSNDSQHPSRMGRKS
jgi:hypothetical protein